jgi:hypothetical protein
VGQQRGNAYLQSWFLSILIFGYLGFLSILGLLQTSGREFPTSLVASCYFQFVFIFKRNDLVEKKKVANNIPSPCHHQTKVLTGKVLKNTIAPKKNAKSPQQHNRVLLLLRLFFENTKTQNTNPISIKHTNTRHTLSLEANNCNCKRHTKSNKFGSKSKVLRSIVLKRKVLKSKFNSLSQKNETNISISKIVNPKTNKKSKSNTTTKQLEKQHTQKQSKVLRGKVLRSKVLRLY